MWFSRAHPRTVLAQSVVDAGAVPLLLLCLQEPEMALKRIAASTLIEVCKHTPELAQAVVDNGAIAHLAQMILSKDTKLKVKKTTNVEALTMLNHESRFSNK